MAEGEGNDATLAILCLTLLVGLFGGLIFFLLRGSSTDEEEQDAGSRGAAKRRQAAAAGEDSDLEEEEEEDGGGGGKKKNPKKDAKKQEKKAQMKADRQMKQDTDSKKSEKQREYEDKQRAKDAVMQKQDDAEERAREAKAKQEQEALDKWRLMYGGDSDGEHDTGDLDADTVDRIVEYVKSRRVASIEDVAAEFKMRTCVAIDHLTKLEKLGRISGFLNARGEYVYLSAQEMSALAEALTQKGRIDRGELVAACSGLVLAAPAAAGSDGTAAAAA